MKLKIYNLLFFFNLAWLSGQTQDWLPLDKGLQCNPNSSYIKNIELDSVSGNIIGIGGITQDGHCMPISSVFSWSGEAWTGMNYAESTMNSGIISFKDTIFIGARITQDITGYMGYYNFNGEWVIVPSPCQSSSIRSFGVHQNQLYASTGIDTFGQLRGGLVLKYEGGSARAYVSDSLGPISGIALAIQSYHDTLFVGGNFDPPIINDNVGINDLCKVDQDGHLHRVGNGIFSASIVQTMCVHRDTLFIGGEFAPGSFEGFDEMVYLLTYDGTHLKPYPIQPNARIVKLVSHGNLLYCAGWYNQFEDIPNTLITELNGTLIQPLSTAAITDFNGNEVDAWGRIFDMEIIRDTLYLAGAFRDIGADTALRNIAKLNRSFALGVEEPHQSSPISIYPNPSNNEIRFTGITYPCQVLLYDSSGRLVLNERLIQPTLDLSMLSSGMYSVQIRNELQTWQTKLVKE